MIFDNGGASFSSIIYTKESENAKVELLGAAKGPVWSVLDKRTRITRWAFFNISTFPSNRCCFESAKKINAIRPTSLPDFQSFFNDFDVFGIDIYSSREIPFSIFMEPRSFTSRIDNRMHVSKFMWAVTLVAHRGSLGNHAEIIIEGVNNGSILTLDVAEGDFFIWRADFSPEIKSIKLEPHKLVYHKRTQVWMTPSYKVHQMLTKINEESEYQNQIYRESGKASYDDYLKSLFFDLGRNSMFYSGPLRHNCLTWAVEKLRIADIHINEIPGEVFASLITVVASHEEAFEKTNVVAWV